MSKKKETGLTFQEATPEQIAAAKQIIEDASKHRYFVSRIFKAYNEITGKNETPQTCSSCLRSRAKVIEDWYREGSKEAESSGEPQLDHNGLPAPARGVIRIPMAEEGVFVDFTPEDGADFQDGAKGTVIQVGGKSVKAGTHLTATGDTLKVQVGGKATFLAAVDDLAT